MVVWDLNPIMLDLGILQVRWYGLVYALGFLLGYLVLLQAAKHKVLPNFSKKDAEEYLFQLIMGSIIMSRFVYVFVYNPGYYLKNILEIPAVWSGGLSIHGGLLGAVLVSYWFCRKRNIPYYKLFDLLVVPLAFVLVFGRIANYVNGELWGRVTDVSWCVEFPGAEGCRHPSPLYEAAYSFVLFLILFVMQQSKKFVDGVLFWSFVGLYGLFRFLVTFLREPDPSDPVLFGLAIGQWLSLLMFLLAVLWFRGVRQSGYQLRRV